MSSRRKLVQLFVGLGVGVFGIMFGVMSATAHVYAGGGEGTIIMTLPGGSAPINTQIKVTLYDYYNSCANGASYGTPYVCSDGSPYIRVPITSQTISVMASGGATLGGTQTYSDGIAYVTTGSDGYAQFTVASATVGSVTVSAAEDHVSPAQSDAAVTQTISFTNPVAAAPAAPAKTTPSTPASTPAATNSPVASKPPSTIAAQTTGHKSGPLVPHPLYWEIGGGVLVAILIGVFVRMQFPKPPPVERAPAYTQKNATAIYPGYEDHKTDPTKEQGDGKKTDDPPAVKDD